MPVKLAWAITIHSAQGMTIDALEVDLGQDIFTWGQAYTGLSRATSLATVRVANVLSSSFVTHPIVLDKFSS
jgi:ATP-dependent DNA helicase PIF1